MGSSAAASHPSRLAKTDVAGAPPGSHLRMTVVLVAKRLARPAPRQRRADQRAPGAFGPGRGTVETEPRQAFTVGRIRGARKSLPQQSRQPLRRVLGVLQDLQCRKQPLLGLGEIAAERKRWQQAGLARRLQRARDPLRKILPMRRRDLKILRQLAGIPGLPRQFGLEAGVRNRQASPRSHRRRNFP